MSFLGTNLTNVDLTGGVIDNARLSNTNLTGAFASSTKFNGTNLTTGNRTCETLNYP